MEQQIDLSLSVSIPLPSFSLKINKMGLPEFFKNLKTTYQFSQISSFRCKETGLERKVDYSKVIQLFQ